jgi:hypothetical protein
MIVGADSGSHPAVACFHQGFDCELGTTAARPRSVRMKYAHIPPVEPVPDPHPPPEPVPPFPVPPEPGPGPFPPQPIPGEDEPPPPGPPPIIDPVPPPDRPMTSGGSLTRA